MSKSPFYKTGVSRSPLFVAKKSPTPRTKPELKPTLIKHEPIKINSTGDEGMMSATFRDRNRTEGNDPEAVNNRMKTINQRKPTGAPLKMNEEEKKSLVSEKKTTRLADKVEKSWNDPNMTADTTSKESKKFARRNKRFRKKTGLSNWVGETTSNKQ